MRFKINPVYLNRRKYSILNKESLFRNRYVNFGSDKTPPPLSWRLSNSFLEILLMVLKHNYLLVLFIPVSITYDQVYFPFSSWQLIPEMLIIYMSIPIMLLMLFWIVRTVRQWVYAIVYGDEHDLTHSYTAFSGLKIEPLALLFNVFLALKITISVSLLAIIGIFYDKTYQEFEYVGSIPFFWIYGVNEIMWFVYLVMARPHKSRYLNRIVIMSQLAAITLYVAVIIRADKYSTPQEINDLAIW